MITVVTLPGTGLAVDLDVSNNVYYLYGATSFGIYKCTPTTDCSIFASFSPSFEATSFLIIGQTVYVAGSSNFIPTIAYPLKFTLFLKNIDSL